MLALYAAAATTMLLLANRFVRPLRLLVAVALVCGPALIAGRALATGGVLAPVDVAYEVPPLSSLREEAGVGPTRSPILSDVVASYLPWRKAVRHAVRTGEWPLWNPFVNAGEPLHAVQEPAVFHPGTWLGFLLPLAQAWTFEMALRLFLALACGYLFFRELRVSEVPALLGACAWGFSEFMIFSSAFRFPARQALSRCCSWA